jgi:hypothetical protein
MSAVYIGPEFEAWLRREGYDPTRFHDADATLFRELNRRWQDEERDQRIQEGIAEAMGAVSPGLLRRLR